MTKGTPSMGLKNKISHIRCRRCGRVAYKVNTHQKKCAACGYGATAKLRSYAWQTHTLQRERSR